MQENNEEGDNEEHEQEAYKDKEEQEKEEKSCIICFPFDKKQYDEK